jgi:hypothetical protein
MYGETKVRLQAPPYRQYISILNSSGTQEVLELNSNDVHLIPDDYRATSIDVMMGMSETFSW